MRILLPVTVLLAILAMSGNLCAQGRTSSSGTFGNRTLGASLSGGQRTFGSNPMTGSRTTADLGSVGQLDSGDRFVRGNRRPGQFVGSDTQDMQKFVGAVQASQQGRGQQQNRAGPTANRPRNTNRPRSTGRASTEEIRARLHIAFSYTKAPSTELGNQLAEQLVKLPQVHALSPLEVQVARGMATLRGTVATDHDRGLAERLVRLEAGIWKVRNELVVAQRPEEPLIRPKPTSDD